MNAIIKIYRSSRDLDFFTANSIDIDFGNGLFVALGGRPVSLGFGRDYAMITGTWVTRLNDPGDKSIIGTSLENSVVLCNRLMKLKSWRCHGGQTDLMEAFNARQPITVEELEALARKVKG